MGQFNSNNVNQSFGNQNQSDMTFFDSKMFANGVLKQGQSSRSVGNRQSGGGGIIGAKFAAISPDAGS